MATLSKIGYLFEECDGAINIRRIRIYIYTIKGTH